MSNLHKPSYASVLLPCGRSMMVDDFHGFHQWQSFESVTAQVCPARQIEDLDDGREAFHVLYDLQKREQIPGIRALMNQRTDEDGGAVPRWRGIVDDRGTIMVAINFIHECVAS